LKTKRVLSVAAALFLAGCAACPPERQADAAAFETQDCVLGVPRASEAIKTAAWKDPVDSLITQLIDQGGDTWLCPPMSPSASSATRTH
jgi:hypothetical protein